MKLKDGIACIKCDGYCFENLIEYTIEGDVFPCEAFVCEFCQEPIMNTRQMNFLLNIYKEKKEKKGMIRKRKEKVKLQKCKRYAIEQEKGFSSVLSKPKGK
jgi:hypothetical protein